MARYLRKHNITHTVFLRVLWRTLPIIEHFNVCLNIKSELMNGLMHAGGIAPEIWLPIVFKILVYILQSSFQIDFDNPFFGVCGKTSSITSAGENPIILANQNTISLDLQITVPPIS
jgi:hypothetical protein